MKKLVCVGLALLMLTAAAPALAGEQGLNPIFTHVFAPMDTPQGPDSDHAHLLRGDGQGGFYALTRDWLLHWQPGDSEMQKMGENGPLMLWGLACHGDQVYAVSLRQGLYRLAAGAWQPLGLPPFLDPDSKAGPAFLSAGLVATPEHLFFFCWDKEQEQCYLGSYTLATGDFHFEPTPVFDRHWACYEPGLDVLVGTAADATGQTHLALYDYNNKTVSLLGSQPFTGEVSSYDPATGWALAGGYEGILLGSDDASMRLLQGSPRRLGILAWLKEGLVAASTPRRGEEPAMICVYRFGPEDLVPLNNP